MALMARTILLCVATEAADGPARAVAEFLGRNADVDADKIAEKLEQLREEYSLLNDDQQIALDERRLTKWGSHPEVVAASEKVERLRRSLAMIEKEKETAADALQWAERKHADAYTNAVAADPSVEHLLSARSAAYQRVLELDSKLFVIQRMTKARFAAHNYGMHAVELPADSPLAVALAELATNADIQLPE
jgi:hypothetical protein